MLVCLLTSSLLLALGILASSRVVLSEERMAGPTLRWFPGFHEPENTGRSHKNSSSQSDRKTAQDMIHFILEPSPFWWRKYRKVVRPVFWYFAQEVTTKGGYLKNTHKSPSLWKKTTLQWRRRRACLCQFQSLSAVRSWT